MLVLKILALAGISIEDPQLYQIATQEEVKQVQEQEPEYLESQVAARNPFGMATNFYSYREYESKGFLKLYRKKGVKVYLW